MDYQPLAENGTGTGADNENNSNNNNGSEPAFAHRNSGRLAARFRRMNILLFAAASCVMILVMALLFNGVIVETSSEYAGRYAVSAAEVLSAHIQRELRLVAIVARSDAVAEWMADETDEAKKARAFEIMTGILSQLYGYNLYVGMENTLNHYAIRTVEDLSEVEPLFELNRDDPVDAWYFASLDSDGEYTLNIGVDRILQRKRVWINYRVVRDGHTLGIISTGMEFSHIVGELFSNYDDDVLRGLILDRNGAILMDSARMDDVDFMRRDYEVLIRDEFSNPGIVAAIESQLGDMNGFYEPTGTPEVTQLSYGQFRHMTISPIVFTDWYVVILSGGVSFFDMSQYLPILLTVLVLLFAVAVVTSAANYRLIFLPLGKLGKSLASMRENQEVHVYGVERDDELGELSKTIQDLFTKANVDALTGIYNRRFMENNLEHIIGMLSRTGGLLSLLMMDIDYFKKYNDTYGHDRGDSCLKSVAGALSVGAARAGDFTARYGGEEFVAILPNTDKNGAVIVAEKLLESVRELEIPHTGNAAAPYVTISIGVTTASVVYGQTWEEYLKCADNALYMSKKNGRNQYTYLEFTAES